MMTHATLQGIDSNKSINFFIPTKAHNKYLYERKVNTLGFSRNLIVKVHFIFKA